MLEKNIIYTTAEIILEETNQLIFKREQDELTRFKELKIEKNADDQ